MIDALVSLIARFPGQRNRVRCFAHIINLVVKIILRQFDSRVKKTKAGSTELDSLTQRLEEALDIDEMDPENEDDDPGAQEDDDSNDGIEEVEGAVQDSIDNMEFESRPVRLILTKVCFYFTFRLDMGADLSQPCALLDHFLLRLRNTASPCTPIHRRRFQLRKLAYAIKNSPTKVQPRWEAILDEISKTPEGKKAGIKVRKFPRDTPTRWNSTYDMADFAYTYRAAVDQLTDDRTLKLRELELTEREWELVRQLRDCLKVRVLELRNVGDRLTQFLLPDLQGHHPLLFIGHPIAPIGHSCNGQRRFNARHSNLQQEVQRCDNCVASAG